MPDRTEFAARLLAWYDRHGRRELPWQREPSAYRVWLSEVMLQQTQVATVIPYFERFTARFPHVQALAGAELDEVLHLWSGLGYYARGRNLHAAARLVVARHGGELPRDAKALAALPGIGRSTAGAILALAFGLRQPILDGNVKRVLARHHAIEGWSGTARVQKALWTIAERLTPARRVADYTQAIMDLGATVCTRSRPRCSQCPLGADCGALRTGRTAELPAPRPRRPLPVRAMRWLIMRDASGAVLLERRPPSGIWGGLWSFPECPEPNEPIRWCAQRYGFSAVAAQPQAEQQHTFTHFRARIHPILLDGGVHGGAAMEGAGTLWYNRRRSAAAVGLAAPVDALLEHLQRTPYGGKR